MLLVLLLIAIGVAYYFYKQSMDTKSVKNNIKNVVNEDIIICKKCGNEIKKGLRFCGECGNQVSSKIEKNNEDLNFDTGFEHSEDTSRNNTSHTEDLNEDIDYVIIDDLEEEDCPTEMLDSQPIKKDLTIKLINNQNGRMEKLKLNGDRIVIGRMRNESDFYIADENISRKHAMIVLNNGKFGLVDLSSKNKTYINNNVLQPEKIYYLNNNDLLTFAKSEYVIEIEEGL